MSIDHKIADHLYDKRSGDPYWNESSWFSFAIPERNINGFFYYFFRPNMKLLGGGPAMWDRTAEHAWDCLYYDWNFLQAMPEGADKYDFRAANSTQVTLIEPLRKYHLLYNRNGLELDLLWEAVAEPHNFLGGSETSAAASFHMEQFGQVRGTAKLNGETYTIDCLSLRDASHGARKLEMMPPGAYLWAITTPSDGFHMIAMGQSAEMKSVGGFLMRDGVVSTLAGGSHRVIQRNGPIPKLLIVEGVDRMGRRFEARGEVKNRLEWQGYPDSVTAWCLVKWTLEGMEGLGEIQEFYSLPDYRRWLREPESWTKR